MSVNYDCALEGHGLQIEDRVYLVLDLHSRRFSSGKSKCFTKSKTSLSVTCSLPLATDRDDARELRLVLD